MIKYTFDHNRKLSIEVFNGEISFDELKEYMTSKFSDPDHNDTYSVFVDLRNSKFVFTRDEREKAFSSLQEYIFQMNMNRRCAFLTNKPNEVVASELFSMRMSKFSEMSFKIFSTEGAAMNWLGF